MSKRSSGARPSQTATSDQPGGGFGLRATSPDLTGDGPPNPLTLRARPLGSFLCCTPEPNRKQGQLHCIHFPRGLTDRCGSRPLLRSGPDFDPLPLLARSVWLPFTMPELRPGEMLHARRAALSFSPQLLSKLPRIFLSDSWNRHGLWRLKRNWRHGKTLLQWSRWLGDLRTSSGVQQIRGGKPTAP